MNPTDPLLVLAGLVVARLLAAMSPGPSFLVVVRAAVAGGSASGAAAALGMGLGALVWAAAALFGLSALFALAPWLVTFFRLAGAAYLLWIAVALRRHADAPPAPAGPAAAPGGARAAFRRGLAVQLSNPKVAVFFGSIFVALLPPDPSPALVAAVLALVWLDETLWYALVARVFSREAARRGCGRARPALDRLTGAFLDALGLRLALDR